MTSKLDNVDSPLRAVSRASRFNTKSRSRAVTMLRTLIRPMLKLSAEALTLGVSWTRFPEEQMEHWPRSFAREG